MSKTIDEKVVEMRFDNKNFEQNVKQSMSTLDKLKQKLNLTGASKGLENINKASNKVDMKGMSSAIEGVQSKFSALEVMGITALANITNSAVNAGKRIVSALTIDPITTGFQEYETQINAIQTILANTQKEGTNVEIVNKALDELNKYADMTIYNFTEMTRNIGTFTAAGVKLDTSVKAIKGIANLAAVSGSNAQQASTAMYQLSQALASGTVKLMDWNSVVNARMGGQVFQDALKETARVHGIAIDQIIKEQGSFRDSLHTGWLTAEILTETLEKFTLSTENMTEAEIQANRERLKSIGYTDEQIDGIFELGKTATDAATKVKTFSQLWGTMKEAAQSGWAQTWRIIIGDFEEAKELLTSISNFFTGDNGVITKMNNSRNALLNGALGKGFEKLKETLNTIVKPVKTVTESVSKVTGALEDLDAMVTKVIRGEFGNGKARFKALTEAGYNYYAIQNKVNEKLGDSFRYSEKLTGAQKELNKTQEETAEVQAKLAGSEEERLEQLAKMTDAELESLGLTKEQIDALRELQKYVDMTGLSFKDFLDNIDQLNGRWLLINSFKNIGSTLVGVFNSIGKAWKDVFPPMQAERLFEIIAGFHKLTLSIKEAVTNEETLDKLTRTLRGLFSILGFITDLVGGGFKLAFNILKTVLSTVANLFGFTTDNILDFTASIGDAIYNARKWIKENSILTKIIEGIVVVVVKAVQALGDWIKNNEVIQSAISNITSRLKELGDTWSNWIEGLKETDNVPKYILEGLVNGFKNIGGAAAEAIIAFGQGLIEAFKNVLGIHSPSKVFMIIGGFIVAGLLLGLTQGFGQVFESIKEFGAGCIDALKSLDLGKILAIGIGAGLIIVAKNIVDAIKGITNIVNSVTAPLRGFGELLEGIGNAAKRWGRAREFNAVANMIKSIGISIALLAASVFVLSKIDVGVLWSTIGAIAALAAIIGVLAFAASKMDNIQALTKSLPIVSIAITLLLLATTLKQLGSIESDRILTAILGLAAIVVALGALIKIIGKTITPDMEKDLNQVGKMIRKISTTLLLLVIVVKLASMLSDTEMSKGIAFVTVFGLFIAGFAAIGNLAGKHARSADKIGSMIKKISVSLLLMVAVVKLSSMLTTGEIRRGLTVITNIGVIFTALTAVSHLAGDNANKAGTMILAMSAAMLLAVAAVRIVSGLDEGELTKGLSAVTRIGVIFGALIAISKFAGDNAIKAGLMIGILSGSLLLMTGVLFILGKIDLGELHRSLDIITYLSILFAGLIVVSRFAGDGVKAIIAISASIALLIGALVGLSVIKPEKLGSAAASLSAVMVALGVLMAASSKMDATKDVRHIYALLPIVVILAAIIGVLAALSPETSIQTALSLSVLMLAMVGVLAILNTIKITNGILAPLLALAGIIILSLGLVFALNRMSGVKNALANALALSVLATTLTGLLIPLAILGAIITGTGGIGAMAIVAGIASLAGMLVPLGLIAALLWAMSGIENATANAKLLTDLLTVLTDTLVKISLIAPLAILGVAALSGLSLIMVVLGTLAVAIGALMTKFPAIEQFLNTGIPILVNLANGVGQMVGAFVSGIMTSIASGLPEIGTYLTDFMTNASGFIDGAKGIDESVVNGIRSLAGAILALTAAELINGVANFISGGSSFAQLGLQLSQFMLNATPFITGLKVITPESAIAAKNLASLIMALTIADVVEGIKSFFGIEGGLDTFGEKLASFGGAISTFTDSISDLTEKDLERADLAAQAGTKMAKMAEVIPKSGGWVQNILGEHDMQTFSASIVAFGEAMVAFSSSVSDLNDDDFNRIGLATEAGNKLADLNGAIPVQGGWWQDIAGEQDLKIFSASIVAFAKAISNYSKEVKDMTDDDATRIEKSAAAGSKLSELQNSLPVQGGWWQDIAGEKDIGEFGNSIITFAKALVLYTKVAKNIDDDSVTAINNSGKAVDALKAVAEKVPSSGGWWAGIAGSKDSKGFGEAIQSLAVGILYYVEAANSITEDNINKINYTKTAIDAISNAANSVPEDNGPAKNAENYMNTMKNVINSIVTYINSSYSVTDDGIASINKTKSASDSIVSVANKLSEIDSTTVESAITQVNNIATAISNLTLTNFTGVDKFIEGIKKLGEANVKDFSDNMNSIGDIAFDDIINAIKDSTNNATEAGKTLIDGMTEGVKNGKEALLKVITNIISKVMSAVEAFDEVGTNIGTYIIEGINSKISSVETAGKDFVQGFANGINNNVDLAINAGSAIGRYALAAAKAAIDSNSPAKETFKLGTFFDQGFMLGIEIVRNKIYDSAYSTGDYAKSGLTKAISRISDVINGDIDTQPTIRPVLDLSDVESGVGYLSSMLSNGPSVGVKANLDSISYGMNAKVQNGVNGDVVSAIDKLRKDLGNTRGDTYNVNGITYDDGSNITEAVREIVRAAKVERRK